jgi:apolipoprotein D and lipocalin family protein
MKQFYLCLIILIPLLVNSQEKMNTKVDPLQTVASVDLLRYMGQWYEIALYPQRFEKGCECTTAEYYMHEKYVEVRNTCTKNGKTKTIKGKAFVVPNSGNAKLKVQFFWPFKGDYWIIALDNDYNWAVVSSPDKNYLWILSRSKKMAPELYQKIITDLINRGFDESRIIKTKHDCSN